VYVLPEIQSGDSLMVGEKVDFSKASAEVKDTSEDGQKRERSTIEFPYLSLDQAEEVASAIYSRCGYGACEIDELAAEMQQSVSGAFRQKTAAAKIFGLVEKDGRSSFVLSELGRAVVDEARQRQGRVEAFLSVPLYQAIFEKYRGHNLPPPKALEREMEALGVSAKQTDKARQAFDRSAAHAGFYESGKDRLVKPRAEETFSPSPSRPHDETAGGGSGGGNGGPPDVDPIIAVLLARLPKAGSEWPQAERKIWLDLLEGSFRLIYSDNSSNQH
jgi:hypothetical protein